MQTSLTSGPVIVAEFKTRKAAEKFQWRVTNPTYIRKAEKSYYGYTWKNVWQLVIKESA